MHLFDSKFNNIKFSLEVTLIQPPKDNLIVMKISTKQKLDNFWQCMNSMFLGETKSINGVLSGLQCWTVLGMQTKELDFGYMEYRSNPDFDFSIHWIFLEAYEFLGL